MLWRERRMRIPDQTNSFVTRSLLLPRGERVSHRFMVTRLRREFAVACRALGIDAAIRDRLQHRASNLDGVGAIAIPAFFAVLLPLKSLEPIRAVT